MYGVKSPKFDHEKVATQRVIASKSTPKCAQAGNVNICVTAHNAPTEY
jgi:hypothetical protein